MLQLVKLISHFFSDRRTKRKTASYSFTAQNESTAIYFALANELKSNSKNGIDIYDQLDKYFAAAAREIALGAPLDDITLIQYLVPSFNRYHAGVQSAHRLLNYINRHYIKRAVEEDRGWLRFSDILDSLAKNISTEDSREVISKILREKRLQELQKWGYAEGDPPDKMAFAESCAEAASPMDRVVPIASLAHRRFRTEVMEPLLASPKIKGKSKAKHKIPKPPTGPNPALPRGRLARAVKELLERDAIDEEERLILASGLAKALQIIGIRNDHALRKKLDKYIAPGNEKT